MAGTARAAARLLAGATLLLCCSSLASARTLLSDCRYLGRVTPDGGTINELPCERAALVVATCIPGQTLSCTCSGGMWVDCEKSTVRSGGGVVVSPTCSYGGLQYKAGESRSFRGATGDATQSTSTFWKETCTCAAGSWACKREARPPESCTYQRDMMYPHLATRNEAGSVCTCADGTWRCEEAKKPETPSPPSGTPPSSANQPAGSGVCTRGNESYSHGSTIGWIDEKGAVQRCTCNLGAWACTPVNTTPGGGSTAGPGCIFRGSTYMTGTVRTQTQTSGDTAFAEQCKCESTGQWTCSAVAPGAGDNRDGSCTNGAQRQRSECTGLGVCTTQTCVCTDEKWKCDNKDDDRSGDGIVLPSMDSCKWNGITVPPNSMINTAAEQCVCTNGEMKCVQRPGQGTCQYLGFPGFPTGSRRSETRTDSKGNFYSVTCVCKDAKWECS